MLQERNTLDYYNWEYSEILTRDYINKYSLQENTIVESVIGSALKISSEIIIDSVGAIHSLALLCDGIAISSTRFITHHDTISSLYNYYGLNPLYNNLEPYILGFSTTENWFLDPWQAYKVAKYNKQIHPSLSKDKSRALQSSEVLFF